MPPTLHAVHGASSSKRWMACPGSIAASEGLPDKTSFYAQEGTAAHEVVEMVLAGDFPDAFALVGETIDVDQDDPESALILVTEEMTNACQVMIDFVLETFAAAVEEDPDTEMWLERSFNLEKIKAPAPMFGTADVTIWSPNLKHLQVIDYKHGQGVVVEVVENSQVMYYGLGATVEVGTLPEEITVSIVQPRAPHDDGPCRSYTFGRDRLIAFKDELFAAVERTLEEDAPLVAGDHCKFCKALAGCPAQRQLATDTAMVAFDIEPEPQMPTVGSLSMEDLSMVLTNASHVMNWLREVESHALTLMEDGVEVPGHKLVRGRAGNRGWTDPEAAGKYLAGKGLKVDERYNKKLISPSQAEKKLKAKGSKLNYLETLWTKPEGKVKIAPEHDKRPAIAAGVERAFGTAEALPPQDENENET